MLPTEYTENFQVYRHDGDCYGCVQPATMLRYAQQIAGGTRDRPGAGRCAVRPHPHGVCSGQQALRFEQGPARGEQLTLNTKPEALSSAPSTSGSRRSLTPKGGRRRLWTAAGC